MPHGDKRHLQSALVNALPTMPTIEQAAKSAGVAKSTALRWMAEPKFRQEYDELRRQALGETLAYLQQSMHAAVAKLVALLNDPQSKPIIQLGAARSLLEYGLRAYELDEVTGRLIRIEDHLAL